MHFMQREGMPATAGACKSGVYRSNLASNRHANEALIEGRTRSTKAHRRASGCRTNQMRFSYDRTIELLGLFVEGGRRWSWVRLRRVRV
jgi:hypothetical protein